MELVSVLIVLLFDSVTEALHRATRRPATCENTVALSIHNNHEASLSTASLIHHYPFWFSAGS